MALARRHRGRARGLRPADRRSAVLQPAALLQCRGRGEASSAVRGAKGDVRLKRGPMQARADLDRPGAAGHDVVDRLTQGSSTAGLGLRIFARVRPRSAGSRGLGGLQCRRPRANTSSNEQRRRPVKSPKRYRLLHGPYAAPKRRVGRRLYCQLRRREVRVDGLTDSPTSWPFTRPRGPRSLTLCGERVRAVRTESASGVAAHWGVAMTTVWKWRRALGVPCFTEGTRRLYQDVIPEKVDLEALAEARRASRTPSARAKISARGRAARCTRTSSKRPPRGSAPTRTRL